MAYKNPAPSSSYVNKDFQKIFPEMLDLVKKLTYKWDPSISNESDPGVVLLKLNAIVNDKSNYNADKGVLEFFPETVTQERNAYSNFKQLGYYPKWLISSDTEVSFKYTGSSYADGTSVTIPRFTMVCDDSDSVVYTLCEKDITLDLSSLRKIVSTKALQGEIHQYTINGDDRIRFSDLDSDRRLYFDELTVAQNGIFIENYGQKNYEEWQITDNVYSEEISSAATSHSSNKFYSFGLSQDLGRCYIEFAEDVEEYIEDGISIKYLTSDGYDGNVPVSTLTKFTEDLKVNIGTTDEIITLNTDNILIKNIRSGVNGRDAETIDESYIGYKRVVGTFNTLVSLRDYINYILRTGLVSNGFVCDRSNDIQSTVRVVTLDNDIDVVKSVVLESAPGVPEMTAFDLKMYLNTVNTEPLDTLEAYKSTFNFVPYTSTTTSSIIRSMTETDACKCVLHDFKDLLTTSQSNPRFCGFRNKFVVSCKVIPQYDITEIQRDEIETNIRKKLFENFNAFKLEYGNEASYDDIYNAILESDDRIKTVYLNDFDYNLYGVVWRNGAFEEIEIANDENAKEFIIANSILAGKTQGIDKDDTYSYFLNMLVEGEKVDIQTIEPIADINWKPLGQTTSTIDYDVVSENENILFYSPSFNEDVTYSTYTRYTFESSRTLEANSIYELEAQEQLTLFWKNESGNYERKTYGEGTKLRTNFALSQTDPSTYTGSDVAVISALPNLGSTNSIAILSKYEVTLNENTKCYWILNSKTNEGTSQKPVYTYNLFGAEPYKYILKSGEYFVYTNEDETALEILGSGTQLELIPVTQKKGDYSVSIISAESILEDGLDADIPWFNLPQQMKVTVMTIVSAGSGTSVHISGLSSTFTGNKWNGNEEYTIPEGAEIKIADTPLTGTIDWNAVDSLEKIYSSDGWVGTSVLNINMSPVKPQKLESNQRIVINADNTNVISNVSSVMSNVYLEFPGAKYIDVRSYNLDDRQYTNASMLCYNSSDTPAINNSSASIVSEENMWKITIPYSNPSQTYNVSFSNKYPKSSKFAFCVLNTNADINTSNIAATRAGSSLGVLSESDTFKYFNFSTNSSTPTEEYTNISITREHQENLTADDVVYIKPLFKYEDGKITGNVSTYIDALDNHSVFDIGYDVNDDIAINNPEDAETFFDPNHIYNKFTLPMISNVSVKITNVK